VIKHDGQRGEQIQKALDSLLLEFREVPSEQWLELDLLMQVKLTGPEHMYGKAFCLIGMMSVYAAKGGRIVLIDAKDSPQ